jgi:SAM-dependent methyltransferase
MKWKLLRLAPWIDTRALFISRIPQGGSLLDIGSSTGETLCHYWELRPDLQFYATDLGVEPVNAPPKLEFIRADIVRDRLPWKNDTFDAITCCHVVEHLHDLSNLLNEAHRLLKKGGSIYIETPHPRSLTMQAPSGKMVGRFTVNFWDDPTHKKIVPIGRLAHELRSRGFEIIKSGGSRNILFAASFLLLFFAPPSFQKLTAYVHFRGWSAFVHAVRL